jgi:exosortase
MRITSYGFLIPIVSAYLLWEKRKELGDLEVKSSWWVLPLLVIFYLLSLYGTLGSSGNISMPSIPILIILFTAFCFGISLTKRLALPLGFFVFMVPVPSAVELSLGIFLKAVSSKLGGLIIRAADIPVFVSGNVIDIGVTQLQVVDACSGMRFLFALLALGVLYAYLFEKVLWKQIFCVFATIPISILTNAMRIGATGILANYYGAGVAEGFFHGFSGWSIFMLAFTLLFLMGRILRLLPPRPVAGAKTAKVQNPLSGKSLPEYKGSNKAFYTSIALIVVFGLFTLSTHALPPVKMQGGIASFSLKFADWEGRAELVDPVIIEKSGAEESFSGVYLDGNKWGQIPIYFPHGDIGKKIGTDSYFSARLINWQENREGKIGTDSYF